MKEATLNTGKSEKSQGKDGAVGRRHLIGKVGVAAAASTVVSATQASAQRAPGGPPQVNRQPLAETFKYETKLDIPRSEQWPGSATLRAKIARQIKTDWPDHFPEDRPLLVQYRVYPYLSKSPGDQAARPPFTDEGCSCGCGCGCSG